MTHYGKVYWIKTKEHHDPSSEGYVGVTIDAVSKHARHKQHFRNLRNGSHPNPILQNAYNKHGAEEFRYELLFEGPLDECLKIEKQLRPLKNIGWNVLEGGGLPPSQKGKHWYTDGTVNKLVVGVGCPIGFRPGKTQVSGPAHGHSGKPKNYKTVQKTYQGNLGHRGYKVKPHVRSKPTTPSPHKGRSWTVIEGKRVWHDIW